MLPMPTPWSQTSASRIGRWEDTQSVTFCYSSWNDSQSPTAEDSIRVSGTPSTKHRLSSLNNGNLFLTVLEAGKFQIKAQQVQCLVCRWLSPGCVLTWSRDSADFSSSPYKDISPVMGAPPS